MILTLSHSSLRDWQICPQLYWLKYVLRLELRRSGGCAAALGTALHSGLAAWHRHGRKSVALGALRAAWGDDWDKDVGWGVALLERYFRQYSPDPDVDRVLFAEKSFSLGLGEVNGVEVRFAGTLDLLPLGKDKGPFILDHKSTSLSYHLWLADQRVSDQWPGYVLGAETLLGGKVRPRRVVLNYLSTRDESADGLRRGELEISDEAIDEWRVNVLRCAGQILDHARSAQWPLFRASCTRQWGRACEWYEHCALPCGSRERFRTHCGDVQPRKPGPTESKVPLGLTNPEASPKRRRRR